MRYRRKNKFDATATDSPATAPAQNGPESSVLEQPSNADTKFAELSSDPNFQKKAGLENSETKKVDVEVIVLTPKDLLVVIDLYAIVISFIFAQILKTKFEVVYNICKFDDDQKKVVSEFAAPVAAKYFPTDWLPYLPEIKLGLALVGITSTKFQQCLEAVKSKTIDATTTKNV